jgi:hypothetical protein
MMLSRSQSPRIKAAIDRFVVGDLLVLGQV